MKKYLLLLLLLPFMAKAQIADLSKFKPGNGVKIATNGKLLTLSWPAGQKQYGQLVFNMDKKAPLFKSMGISNGKIYQTIVHDLQPEFVLTVGIRDLISQNGWNIFFDKVPKKPHQSYRVRFNKQKGSVITDNAHTIVRIPGLAAPGFSGYLEVTVYNGSPLFNVAAVMTTQKDSTAILYDAGLVSKSLAWKSLAWANTDDQLQTVGGNKQDTSRNLPVKYRSIIGENAGGCLAVFPAPHQFFYPLDEAFNLKFTWYGNNYRQLLPGYGIGIRQELEGDKRFVPWFNAPPGTAQRLNFFCLLSGSAAATTLEAVKRFTHHDSYVRFPGYKTMTSHFHNEFIMKVVLAGKPVPDSPNFVKVFKRTGVDIVHLAEFHYTAHPKGPDDKRLTELKALFAQCQRLSGRNFLLLPGEEPNEFFGGHWLAFFPHPVYWVMSRKGAQPYVATEPGYGKVYHIGNKNEMLKLLQDENGLAWTAHARTKGSTGYPDKYKDEPFFHSDHFMGAVWKALPADLSQPRLGKRALDLLDDMNNWGLKKHMLGEADLFSIEPENEMYAHLNVNYLQLDKLPDYNNGWQAILDVLQQGRFFTTTGEILLPAFSVNGAGAGQTVAVKPGNANTVKLSINWTFPLNFAEIISGDGQQVYRKHINLKSTHAFGNQAFSFNISLKNRKWVRVEVWDIAANGAFTQTVYLR